MSGTFRPMKMLTSSWRLLQHLSLWLARLAGWKFLLLVAAIAISKSTISWHTDFLAAASSDELSKDDFAASNLIATELFRLLGMNASLYAVIALSALGCAAFLLWRLGLSASAGGRIQSRTLAIWALGWPILYADLAWFGNGHELLPLFFVLSVAARPTPLWIVGTMLVALSHPEQGFIAFISLFVLSMSSPFRQYRSKAITGVASSLLTVLATTVWLSGQAVQPRTFKFFDLLGSALELFVKNAPIIVYSGWGVWWLLVLFALASMRVRRDVLVVVAATIVLPLTVAALTVDGVRVFTGVAGAVGVTIFIFLSKQLGLAQEAPRQKSEQGLLGLSFLVFLILPNVQTVYWGEILSPGTYWINLVKILGA